jgi:hypothetical protein
MNLPVLFRTIDGTSQVTIETQYATELLLAIGWYGEPADYVSLSSRRQKTARPV